MNILEQEDVIKGLPDEVLIQQAEAPTGELPQFLVVSEIQRREKMRSKFDEQVPQNTVTDQIISGGIAAMNPNPDPLMSMAMGAPDPMMGQDPMMQPPMQDPMMGQMPQDPMMMQDPMMQQQMQPPMQDPMMQDPMMQQQMMAAGGGMMPYRMNQGTTVPYQEDFSKSPIAPDRVRILRGQGYSDEQILQMIREESLNRGAPTSQDLYGVGEEADIFKGRTSYPFVPELVTENVKDVLEGSDIAKYGFGYQRNEGGQQGLMGVPMGAAEDLAKLSEMARQSQIVRDPIGSSRILSNLGELPIPFPVSEGAGRRTIEQAVEEGVGADEMGFGGKRDLGDALRSLYAGENAPWRSGNLLQDISDSQDRYMADDSLPFVPIMKEFGQVGDYFRSLAPTTILDRIQRTPAPADGASEFRPSHASLSDPADAFSSLMQHPMLQVGSLGDGRKQLSGEIGEATRVDIARVKKPKLGEAGFLEGFDPDLAKMITAGEAGGAGEVVTGSEPAQELTDATPNALTTAAERVGTGAETDEDTESLSRGLFGRSYKPMDDGALALINLGAGIAKGDITGGMQSAVTAMGEERDRRRKEELSSAQAEYYLSAGDRTSKKTKYDMQKAARATVTGMSLVDRKNLLSKVLGKEVSMDEAGTPDMMKKLIDIIARQYAAQTQISANAMVGPSPDQAANRADPLQAAKEDQTIRSIGRSVI
tara:strand:- start:3714 stop:5828 length:2115 start_codon:yes stop_codon:yes gene_type:complete